MDQKVEAGAGQKKRSKWRYLGWAILIVLIIWVIIFLFPREKRGEHDFFTSERPLVIAHQGGKDLAPSSTLEAFQNAKDIGADVIEFDIHMTKDGHLVAIHDDTVDRTTDGEGRVNDLTLEEIQSLDAGANFQDLNGNHSFRKQGVIIPSLEEIFEHIPDMRWNIEIKTTNDPELYQTISEKLWKTIQHYGLEGDALIVSFDQEIIDLVEDVSGGQALIAGSRAEVTKFVIFHKLFLNGLYRPQVDALQIPTEEGPINLEDKKLIRGAEKAGVDIHYWTINEENSMEKLIDLGAHGILTDRPDILIDLLNEK
ncbi:glycerophosphodiester phosphodiesterase [Virgibacillus sp. MSJ-26]|nr:glycerophosphodiester phosphodiesterase [Virgibacillus sp. MSJ-26]